MTIVGEAFIIISPEGGSAAKFATKLDSELKGANFTSTLDKQLSNAGVTSGNSYVSKFVKALSIGGVSGGAVLGVAVAGAAIAGLAAIGASFQKVRAQIAQETGATGAQLTTLADDVTQAFRKVPVSLSQAADAVDELRRRGVPLGPQLESLAQQELFLAKITKEQVAPTVDATTALFAKFNVATSDQSRELDVLFKAQQQSGKGLDVLVSGLTTGAASLQKFGFTLDTSTALLATLEKEGFNVAPALAALRLGFGKIAQEGGNPVTVLHNLVKELTDGQNPAKGMADAIKLFGTRSGVELATAIQKGALSASGLIKIITDGKNGIVQTGLATLTLGDQFKLLRNNVEADLSGIGTVVLHDLEDVLKGAAAPVEALATGFGHLLVALSPVATALPIFLLPLKLAEPVIADVGAGLDAIASALGHVPGPALAGAAAAGIFAFAIRDLGIEAVTTTAGIELLGEASIAATAELVTNPIFLAVAAVAALGLAFREAGAEGRAVKAEATDLSTALFVSNNAATLLAGGVKSVAAGLASYLEAGSKAAHVTDALKASLVATGGTLTTVSRAVGAGGPAFEAYKKSLIAALTAGGASKFLISDVSRDLDDQRKAFEKSAAQTLTNAEANGILTKSQVANAEATTANSDGTVNYTKTIQLLNTQLTAAAAVQNKVTAAKESTSAAESKLAAELAAGTISEDSAKKALAGLGFVGDAVTIQLQHLKDQAALLTEQQDKTAFSTASSTTAYRELARQIATGSVVEQEAINRLVGMRFSAAGAKQAFSDLQSAISTFVSTAVGNVPDAGKVIGDLASQSKSDASAFQQDLNQQASLQRQLQAQLQTGAASTGKSISSINLKISEDEKNIADGTAKTTSTLDRDLAHRTTVLQTAATSGGKASASLTLAIQANNAKIHKDYAKLVADNDPAKFTKILIANTVKTAQFMTDLQTLVTENFGNLAGSLAAQGPEAAGALAKGFASDKSKAAIANAAVQLGQETTNKYTDFLKQNFPELSLATSQLGSVVGAGMAKGLTAELLKEFPQLRAIGVGVGDVVGGAITTSVDGILSKHDDSFARFGTTGATQTSDAVRRTLAQHREDIVGLFEPLGHDVDAGVAKGIVDKTIDVTKAINKMTGGALSQARHDFRSNSPSLEFYDIGTDVGAGLVLGLHTSEAPFAKAMTKLATAGTASFTKTLSTGLAKGAATGSKSISDHFDERNLTEKLFGPKAPTLIPAPHPTLLASGLSLSDFPGLQRPDATAQFRAAQVSAERALHPVADPPHAAGVFAGATIQFPERQDPAHIAAELAWRFQNP